MDRSSYRIYPLGDAALTIEFGQAIDLNTHQRVRALAQHLDKESIPGLIEHFPSFAAVTLFYDPVTFATSEAWERNQSLSPYQRISEVIELLLDRVEANEEQRARIMQIPVCYGGEYGPDLNFVAEFHRLTPAEVIEIHCRGEYPVYMIGFAPGFPYLGGMAEKIAAPRKASPRLAVPAGSVGIGGRQTGIYPIETPGGWQLIGRTPLTLFRPQEAVPSLLRAGDIVRFAPISSEEFQAVKEAGS